MSIEGAAKAPPNRRMDGRWRVDEMRVIRDGRGTGPVVLSSPPRDNSQQTTANTGTLEIMSPKFTLQALALTGILAVSGLPALAADMAAPPLTGPRSRPPWQS